MGDGAHLGVTANRALGTILGDDEQPTDEERSTPEETRARLEAAPLFEGPKPWDVAIDIGTEEAKNAAYGYATDSLAHAFMVLIEEDSSLLEPQLYPETYPDGSPMSEVLVGKRRDQSSVVWDAMIKRWPNADEWVGGASGFMVGFALNAALYAAQKEIAFSNPAIIEIQIPNG